MMPCTQSKHPVPEAAKQPQNIGPPPPCLTVRTVFFSLKASFQNGVVYLPNSYSLSRVSKGHSPRSPVACQYAFLQIPVSLFYDLLSTVVSSLVNFGSNCDEWCDLTLMYLDLEFHS